MEEISIKVNIADRFYPLRINSSDEESVRLAAKLINDKLKIYQDNYSIKDKQDALCMVALEIATANQALSNKEKKEDTELKKLLEYITQSLEKATI